MTTTLLQLSILVPPLNTLHHYACNKPINTHFTTRPKIASFHQRGFKLKAFREKWSFFEVGAVKGRIFIVNEESKRKKRLVLVRFNQGFGGGGGGGGRDNSETIRVVGNVALAIGLTYFSITGQLGWLFDAIGSVLDFLISLWLLAIIVPIVGLGAFLWWAGRDILQGTCPNCGNEFQVFKSTLNNDLQQCPYCSQPFSVAGDEFMSDSGQFSKGSMPFSEAFRDFSSGSKKGKGSSSSAIVDVEAEVKDVD
ncbi:uncharacterized protein LOC126670396 [Mercurialis annua]|uniref:uncharacterized protein LOC126670396 n=1 Tax=Mercurialis annua TaxID=3986 RepID=UPI00215FDEEC|nr:uncharacterized protein LOC126670396 [Mercurialis annua]XP_055960782.1 uncharacterized protein LOC126670396 [Mercurialis annua]